MKFFSFSMPGSLNAIVIQAAYLMASDGPDSAQDRFAALFCEVLSWDDACEKGMIPEGLLMTQVQQGPETDPVAFKQMLLEQAEAIQKMNADKVSRTGSLVDLGMVKSLDELTPEMRAAVAVQFPQLAELLAPDAAELLKASELAALRGGFVHVDDTPAPASTEHLPVLQMPDADTPLPVIKSAEELQAQADAEDVEEVPPEADADSNTA